MSRLTMTDAEHEAREQLARVCEEAARQIRSGASIVFAATAIEKAARQALSRPEGDA